MNELLLTPKEIEDEITGVVRRNQTLGRKATPSKKYNALLSLQLAKACPLIEKAGRERILKALPKNPWAESDNRGCNPDKRVAVDIILDNVRQALKSD